MWSEPETVTAPASKPVEVADAKTFVRVDHSDEDALFETLIDAAVSQAESITGTRLVSQTVELEADDWSDLEHLPIGPIASIDALTYNDADGTEQTVAAANYELIGRGLTRSIRPTFGNSWPTGKRSETGTIRLTAVVGYDDIPDKLIAAILLMVGDLYANRETVVTGTVAAKVPTSMQVQSLLDQHRIWL